MRRPARVMEKIAKMLESGNEAQFEAYMDKLTAEELKACLKYARLVQALMLDGLARLESQKKIIVPESKVIQ
jgi:uncharacterized protein Yka (UPF0111/DUF47 family)